MSDQLELVKKLSSNHELSRYLKNLKDFSEDIWRDRLLPWFTNHNVRHSEEIIFLLGQVLTPIENTDQVLNEHELFILLAAAYLHDIGMQNLKKCNKPIDSLTEEDYNVVRKWHCSESYEIIIKKFKTLERDDYHFPDIDEDYIPAIAKVSKGHGTDFFDEVIDNFRNNPETPKGREVRCEMLTALLMIGDELDLHNKRIQFSELKKFELSDYSQMHWYKHHYVDLVKIENGVVKITLKFPQNSEAYKDLIKEEIETKLKLQFDKVNPILRKSSGGLLNFHDINFNEIFDDTGIKRKMPEGTLSILKRKLSRETSESTKSKDILKPFSAYPKPRHYFTGRERELKEFDAALNKSSIISIEGLGGIGKTEFAARCIEKSVDKEKVVWFECTVDSKLDLLIDISGYSDVLKGESKTELSKYSGFADLIERDEKVIFLDDFQYVRDNSFYEFLKRYERRLNKAKLVLISREKPRINGVTILPIKLNGLDKDSFAYGKKIIENFCKNLRINDDDLDNVCTELKGHPLAIKFAIQLIEYGESPKDIINKIVQLKDIDTEKLSERLLAEIFNHPKSSEDEKMMLLNFSIYRNAVKKNAIKGVFEGDNIEQVLYSLIDKYMIFRSNGLYSTHPLVREFCYQKLANKKEIHLKAAQYLETEREEKFNPALEEEIFYHLIKGDEYEILANIISTKGENFILTGHTNSLIDIIAILISKGTERPEFYIYYGDAARIRGEWDSSLSYYKKAYSFKKINEKVSAEAYIKYGEMLYRKGDIKESLNYFEEAYDLCKQINFRKGEARSLNDIGLVNKIFGNFDIAKNKIEQAYQIYKEIDYKKGVARSLYNIGIILNAQGYLDDALEKYKESLKIQEEIGNKEDIARSLNNIGSIFHDKGELNNALEKYKESLKIAEEIGDKAGIARSLNNIGSIFHDKSELNGALEKYKEGLIIAEEIGDKVCIPVYLDNIGSIFRDRGDIYDALEKHNESFKVRKEIGEKDGIAASLNYIGLILETQGELKGALEKFNESLKIAEEIGNKESIAKGYHNCGTIYYKGYNDFSKSIMNFLISLAIQNQITIKRKETVNYLYKIRNELGLKKFKSYLEEAFNNIPGELKRFVNTDDFTKVITIQHETPTVGRNNPCPCGSGKKYKKCCGK